jgi:hypothetical protein
VFFVEISHQEKKRKGYYQRMEAVLQQRKFLQEIRQNSVSQTLDSSRLTPSQALVIQLLETEHGNSSRRQPTDDGRAEESDLRLVPGHGI